MATNRTKKMSVNVTLVEKKTLRHQLTEKRHKHGQQCCLWEKSRARERGWEHEATRVEVTLASAVSPHLSDRL